MWKMLCLSDEINQVWTCLQGCFFIIIISAETEKPTKDDWEMAEDKSRTILEENVYGCGLLLPLTEDYSDNGMD